MVDSYYTPAMIADRLVLAVRDFRPRRIFDPAAGTGNLLSAAVRRWNPAAIIANDNDRSVSRHLQQMHPLWSTTCCDFLNSRSRDRISVLQAEKNAVDLAILNPPFSCRGAETVAVAAGGDARTNIIECSRGLAFVFSLLPYMSAAGRILALLPSNVPFSEKDGRAWEWLCHEHSVKELFAVPRGSFLGCAARVTAFEICNRVRRRVRQVASHVVAQEAVCAVFRGTQKMHRIQANRQGFRLVHSTSLRNGSVSAMEGVRVLSTRYASASSVLVPRVGMPSPGKIAVYNDADPVALSDCVIAIQCRQRDVANAISLSIVRQWREFKRLHSGTCAPYITVKRLVGFLEANGFGVA